MENSLTQPKETKKPYSKPQLKKVNLRPEEAVLGGCKSASAAGPTSGACTDLSCMSIGS